MKLCKIQARFGLAVGARCLLVALLSVGPVWAAPPRPAGHRADRILIKPAAGASPEELEKLHARLGTHPLRKFAAIGDLQIIRLPAGASVQGIITAYQKSQLVAYAEPDFTV